MKFSCLYFAISLCRWSSHIEFSSQRVHLKFLTEVGQHIWSIDTFALINLMGNSSFLTRSLTVSFKQKSISLLHKSVIAWEQVSPATCSDCIFSELHTSHIITSKSIKLENNFHPHELASKRFVRHFAAKSALCKRENLPTKPPRSQLPIEVKRNSTTTA